MAKDTTAAAEMLETLMVLLGWQEDVVRGLMKTVCGKQKSPRAKAMLGMNAGGLARHRGKQK